MTQFTDLGLSGPILQALAAADYDTPTPIQAQAIPLVLQGKDLLGIAQTGTGKTAAFTLPSLDILARANKRPGPRSCRMLVLSPTRELASQIADNATRYARFLPINITTAFGGVPIGKQQRALAGGVDILVATPGRLIDLIENRMLSLDKVEILVLDEADQMMDLGFIHALRRIVGLLPRQAPDAVLLRHHAVGDQGPGGQVPARPGAGRGDARRVDGRKGRTARHLRQPAGEAGAADADAADDARWSAC
jgi:ATP-dependent RNA helicase RhlE